MGSSSPGDRTDSFTEPQIVEPVFVIAFYTAVSKFGDALEPVFSEIESILHFKH